MGVLERICVMWSNSNKSGELLRKAGGGGGGAKLDQVEIHACNCSKLNLTVSPLCLTCTAFRAVGATAAANAGVEYRLFKRHGRW